TNSLFFFRLCVLGAFNVQDVSCVTLSPSFLCQSFIHCHCFELGTYVCGHNFNHEDNTVHFLSGECHQFMHTIRSQ
ncbi:Alanine--tRNA ligase, partial [Frankliniella fusca]